MRRHKALHGALVFWVLIWLVIVVVGVDLRYTVAAGVIDVLALYLIGLHYLDVDQIQLLDLLGAAVGHSGQEDIAVAVFL